MTEIASRKFPEQRYRGRRFVDEALEIERPLNDEELEEVKQAAKTSGSDFSANPKSEFGTYDQHIRIEIPRIRPGRLRFLQPLVNYFDFPDVLEVFVYSGYGKKYVTIRQFSENHNPYLERLGDAIFHLYLRTNQNSHR